MDWCISRGECKFNGNMATCKALTESDCESICRYSDRPDCVDGCVGSIDVDCPYTCAPIGSAVARLEQIDVFMSASGPRTDLFWG